MASFVGTTAVSRNTTDAIALEIYFGNRRLADAVVSAAGIVTVNVMGLFVRNAAGDEVAIDVGGTPLPMLPPPPQATNANAIARATRVLNEAVRVERDTE
jgi:hypothetical protein